MQLAPVLHCQQAHDHPLGNPEQSRFDAEVAE